MYRISCGMNCGRENACVIELDDQSICRLSSGEWYKVISEGLRCLGYVEGQKVASVVVETEIHTKTKKCHLVGKSHFKANTYRSFTP